MGYEMNPCFWTDAGEERENTFITDANPLVQAALIDEFWVPCRTVCQNGVLDIEEECEPFEDLIDVGGTCLWEVTNPGTQYEYCSDTCMCKEGWEINPDFDRSLAQTA